MSLSEEWRARAWSGLVCVLVSIGLVVIVDDGGNGYDRESNWLN